MARNLIGYRSGVEKLGKERDWSGTTKKRDRVAEKLNILDGQLKSDDKSKLNEKELQKVIVERPNKRKRLVSLWLEYLPAVVIFANATVVNYSFSYFVCYYDFLINGWNSFFNYYRSILNLGLSYTRYLKDPNAKLLGINKSQLILDPAKNFTGRHVENLNLPSCNFLNGATRNIGSLLRSLLEKHSTSYEETMYLPLCAGLPKPRYSLCYSLDSETPNSLQLSQLQANKHPAPTDSSSGDELVKKARTGSLVEILDVKLKYSGVSVDDDSIYEIPHELGGSKSLREHEIKNVLKKSRHSRNLEKAIYEIENVSKQTVVAATHKIHLSTLWETSKPIAGDANVGDIITLEGDKANTDGNGPIIIFSRDRGKTRATADENAVVKEDSTVPMTWAWNLPVARDSEETEFRAKVIQLAISWTLVIL
ncbi:hypothetical protein DAPPUDRAFT_108035 [Daphnia pulex]|uniref:Uncharacterized protein n=1 Tax=Daphnia pulex TaxID=6669 RepID=E9GYY7_DAPPU|nr:hypothetical protein DAPPUDRAFT_108035 [Daphnia pulex]|eukprot:EFX75236.1 hypothetical protein DAPPUDRAFT_108035 [Daphnia pulex]